MARTTLRSRIRRPLTAPPTPSTSSTPMDQGIQTTQGVQGHSASSRRSEDSSLWRSPFLWLGAGILLALFLVPVYQETKVQRVMGIMANDVSQSGLANPEVLTQHCRAVTKQLKAGDYQLTMAYADTSQVTHDRPIQNTIGLMDECQRLEPPSRVGVLRGTSPVQMLNQVIGSVKAARNREMHLPIAVTIWLQAAEPVPGEGPVTLEKLESQLQDLTQLKAKVAIFGPTGVLQDQFLKIQEGNAQVRFCPTDDLESCVDWAYGAARHEGTDGLTDTK